MLLRRLAAAGGGLARRGFFGPPLSATPTPHMHYSMRAAAEGAATPTAAVAEAAPAAATASAAAPAPRCCRPSSLPQTCPAELLQVDTFKWSLCVADLKIRNKIGNCSSSSSSDSNDSSSGRSSGRHNVLRAERRTGRSPFVASSSSIIVVAAAATRQQQQVRCISTKRRRYFKMRKFHKKKYKKRLMRSNKVPFVDIQKPKRTWKTLKETQMRRKQFRRGLPGKGARMLRLKRQR